MGCVGLLGANLGGFVECVLLPAVDFHPRLVGHSYLSVLDLGLERPMLPGKPLQYRCGGCVLGNRVADVARPLGWVAAPRGGGLGGRGVGEHALDLVEIFGALALIAVEQAPFLDKVCLVVVVFAAPDGVPYVAVGQKAVGTRAAAGMPDYVAHQLALGSARMGESSAFQVGVERLGFQDGGGGLLAGERRGDVVQHNVRAAVPRLEFAPLMDGRKSQELQRGVYEMADGVLFAVIAERD